MADLVEKLKEIGFNSYEAKVYIALLKKYPATGYEVSKLANIPQARTYDTLKVLEQKNIVATTNTAKSLSSYCWAGLGVALAFQDSWLGFFDSISQRSKYVAKKDEGTMSTLGNKLRNCGKNTINITKSFFNSLGKSCKSLWSGNPADTGFMRHAGKGFVLTTAALTAFLTANTIIRAKNMAKNKNAKTIDKTKESTVI